MCEAAVCSCTFTNIQLQVNKPENTAEHANEPTTITGNKIDMHAKHLNAERICKHTQAIT